MFLLWAILLGLLIGFLRRGSLHNLAQVSLRAPWLILIALAIQLLIFPLGGREPLVHAGREYLHLGSYLLLLGFAGLNRRYWEILLMGAGLVLNLVVIAANGGYMPASAEALRRAGLEGVAAVLERGLPHGNVILMTSKTRLNPLGDWLYLPAAVPLANAFSVGDLVLGLGIVLFLARWMVGSAKS